MNDLLVFMVIVGIALKINKTDIKILLEFISFIQDRKKHLWINKMKLMSYKLATLAAELHDQN